MKKSLAQQAADLKAKLVALEAKAAKSQGEANYRFDLSTFNGETVQFANIETGHTGLYKLGRSMSACVQQAIEYGRKGLK